MIRVLDAWVVSMVRKLFPMKCFLCSVYIKYVFTLVVAVFSCLL